MGECPTCGMQYLEAGSWGLGNLPLCPDCSSPAFGSGSWPSVERHVIAEAVARLTDDQCWEFAGTDQYDEYQRRYPEPYLKETAAEFRAALRAALTQE